MYDFTGKIFRHDGKKNLTCRKNLNNFSLLIQQKNIFIFFPKLEIQIFSNFQFQNLFPAFQSKKNQNDEFKIESMNDIGRENINIFDFLWD